MTFEQRRKQNQFIRDYANYGIIVLVSLVSVIFLPMLTSKLPGGFEWPDSTIGWIIWVVTKVSVAIINIIIFYCFINQAKINVRDNERYKKANEELYKMNKSYEYKPRSPESFQRKQWTRKGITIFITSITSAFVFGEVILNFDLETFLSYLFTIFMCIIFSYITMRNNEDYWVSEFPEYVDNLKREIKNKEQENQSISDSSNKAQNCQNFCVSEIDKEIVSENENVEILTDLEVNNNA